MFNLMLLQQIIEEVPSTIATIWNLLTNSFVSAYNDIDCDGTGNKIVAVNGDVWYSTDAGSNWTEITPPTGSFAYCTISKDGSTIYVTGTFDPVYRSDNGGSSWTLVEAGDIYRGISCSDNGNVVGLAALGGGTHYTRVSTNRGTSWNTTGTGGFYTDIAVSGDGTVVYYCRVYSNSGTVSHEVLKSTNGGVSWSDITPGGYGFYNTSSFGAYLSCSGDGQTILYSIGINIFSISTNGGTSWSNNIDYVGHFGSSDMSLDGQVLLLPQINVPVDRGLVLSTDGGATWSTRPKLHASDFTRGVACSSNGQKIVAIPMASTNILRSIE